MTRHTADLVVMLVVAVVLGVLGYLLGALYSQPDCPTEDSCSVDYREGHWHITEVNP